MGAIFQYMKSIQGHQISNKGAVIQDCSEYKGVFNTRVPYCTILPIVQ